MWRGEGGGGVSGQIWKEEFAIQLKSRSLSDFDWWPFKPSDSETSIQGACLGQGELSPKYT